MVIYLLTFPNGKTYVGRTKNTFNQRLIEHKTRATKGYQHPLYYAFNKYGWENVDKLILEEVTTHNQAVLRELHYINKYDSLYNGYNLTLNTEIGGDMWEGKRDTEQYREFCLKMKELNIGENNSRYGKTHSDETKQLLKDKAKGRFSLPWYIERNGLEEGTQKYNDRCFSLKNRNLKKDINGRFTKGL